jgi:hypothetical protein
MHGLVDIREWCWRSNSASSPRAGNYQVHPHTDRERDAIFLKEKHVCSIEPLSVGTF